MYRSISQKIKQIQKLNKLLLIYSFTEVDYTGFVKCFPVLDTQRSFRHIH